MLPRSRYPSAESRSGQFSHKAQRLAVDALIVVQENFAQVAVLRRSSVLATDRTLQSRACSQIQSF